MLADLRRNNKRIGECESIAISSVCGHTHCNIGFVRDMKHSNLDCAPSTKRSNINCASSNTQTNIKCLHGARHDDIKCVCCPAMTISIVSVWAKRMAISNACVATSMAISGVRPASIEAQECLWEHSNIKWACGPNMIISIVPRNG